jgi:hypothetical protein
MELYKGRIASASELCRFASSVVMVLAEKCNSGTKPKELIELWKRVGEVLGPGPRWHAFSSWPESTMLLFDPDISRAMASATRELTRAIRGGQGPEDEDKSVKKVVANLRDAVDRMTKSESFSDVADEVEDISNFFMVVAENSLGEASRAREELSTRMYGVPAGD